MRPRTFAISQVTLNMFNYLVFDDKIYYLTLRSSVWNILANLKQKF